MPLWILIAGVLIPQEFASSAIVFVIALSHGFPIWEINVIWICVTALDMSVGYRLGIITKKKLNGTRFFNWIERGANKMKTALGLHGEKFSLALLGVVDFPYVNTFLGAWIGLPFRTAFLLSFAGNFIWYMFLWGTVLGLSSFISNPDIIILILIVIGGLSYFVFRFSKTNKG
jgi:hypothetical protein